MKLSKTNAARLLDKAGIGYDLIPYQVDEEHLDAGHVAEQLHEDIRQVFKTLVMRGDRSGVFVCIIPGDCEVDLKAASKVSGNKSAAMIHLRELLETTGYIRGGCSPIGMKKYFPTFIDLSAKSLKSIVFSAGRIGRQVELAPADLEKAVRITYTDLSLN